MNAITKDSATGVAILVATGTVLFLAFKAQQTAREVAQAVNPVSRENVINKAANAFVQDIAGDSLTIGERFFRAFNPEEAEALCRAGQTKFCTNSGSKPVTTNETVGVLERRLDGGPTLIMG